jgi:hypothetical protein
MSRRTTQRSAASSSAQWRWSFGARTRRPAIALANDSDFGLGGSVWTKDVTRGQRVASRVETGMIFINSIDWSDAELPFSRTKGRERRLYVREED